MAESFLTDADLSGAGEFFDATALNLGQTYLYEVNGSVTHVRFRTPAAFSGGTNRVGLYQTTDDDPPVSSGAGTLLDDATVDNYVADSWVAMALDAPVSVRPGIPYRPVWFNSVGRYRAKAGVLNDRTTRGFITSAGDSDPAGGFDLRNGTYQVSGALTYTKDSTGTGTAYFVDTVFTPDHQRVRPGWVPDLTATPGLYAFGHDIEFTDTVTIHGLYWYQPAGTVSDVDITLYLQATEAVLATGSILAANLLAGAWNFIPLDTPYVASAGTTYTMAAQTDGTHGYSSSGPPFTSPDGVAEIVQTRYESGGGYPATEWGSGMHALDTAYTVGGAGPAVGTVAVVVDLAVATTGERASTGQVAVGLELAAAVTGERESTGTVAVGVELAVATAGERESTGAVAAALQLAVDTSGNTTPVGAVAAGLVLTPAVAGERESTGQVAAGLVFTVTLAGDNGTDGRPVTPWPWPPDPVSTYPWTPRPVRPFEEVTS